MFGAHLFPSEPVVHPGPFEIAHTLCASGGGSEQQEGDEERRSNAHELSLRDEKGLAGTCPRGQVLPHQEIA